MAHHAAAAIAVVEQHAFLEHGVVAVVQGCAAGEVGAAAVHQNIAGTAVSVIMVIALYVLAIVNRLSIVMQLVVKVVGVHTLPQTATNVTNARGLTDR